MGSNIDFWLLIKSFNAIWYYVKSRNMINYSQNFVMKINSYCIYFSLQTLSDLYSTNTHWNRLTSVIKIFVSYCKGNLKLYWSHFAKLVCSLWLLLKYTTGNMHIFRGIHLDATHAYNDLFSFNLQYLHCSFF